MRIKFTVYDIPPKKDGANSMWNKKNEAPRIISLRKAAYDEMKKIGLEEAFSSSLKLELRLFAPRAYLTAKSGYYIGDLDTFLTGICDSLQAAHENTEVTHTLFRDLENTAINFRKSLIFQDDAQIISIFGEKKYIDANIAPYYEITIEEFKIN